MRNRQAATTGSKNSRGDTLIEVLISMAILALVLGVAYATSSRSLQAGTDASLRSQALSQAQQQIEILKTIAVSNPTQITSYKVDRPFCINPATTAVVLLSDGEVCTLPIGATADTALPYSVVNSYDDATKTFTVKAQWQSSRAGGEPNSVTLLYKTQNSFDVTPSGDPPEEPPVTSPEEPFVRLTANPPTAVVLEGDSIPITWTTTRTTSCNAPQPEPNSGGNAAGWAGPKNKDGGTVSVGPVNVDTILRISCMRGAIGPATDSITVKVQKILSFTATPNPVNYNSFTDISWDSVNTTSCSGTGGTGGWAGSGKATSGTQRINNMTANTTFNLSCTGDAGTISATPRPVTVNPPPAPVVDVWTSPTSIGHGSSSNIYWRVTNGGISGTSCNAYGSWSGARTPGNGEQLGPANTGGLSGPNTYTYGISCTGPGGSHSDSATVSVAGPPPPPPDCGDHNHNLSYSISGSFVTWSSSIGGNNPCGVGISQCNVFNSGGGSLGQVGSSGSGNFPGAAYMRCMDVQGHWFG